MSSFPQSAVTQPGATSGASSVNQEKTGTAGVCRTCPVHQAKGQHDDQHQVDHALCAAEKVCIQEVMNRYYHYFDTQNVEAWLALWSKDGEFRTNRSQARGSDELRHLIQGHLRRSSGSRHACLNPIVDMRGNCCATAKTLMVMFDGKQPPAKVLASALCEWEFCKSENGEWKICRHAFTLDPSWQP